MLNLLFANPDPKLTQVYVGPLSKHFSVDSVSDGLEGLRKIKLSAPEVIVSEYSLPLLTGLSLLKFVRNHPIHHRAPFMFLSNYHDNSAALSLAASDWFSLADCNPDYLLERIFYHLKANKHGI